MLKYFAPIFAVALIGGFVTGKSAFGAEAKAGEWHTPTSVSYTHLRAHETG